MICARDAASAKRSTDSATAAAAVRFRTTRISGSAPASRKAFLRVVFAIRAGEHRNQHARARDARRRAQAAPPPGANRPAASDTLRKPPWGTRLPAAPTKAPPAAPWTPIRRPWRIPAPPSRGPTTFSAPDANSTRNAPYLGANTSPAPRVECEAEAVAERHLKRRSRHSAPSRSRKPRRRARRAASAKTVSSARFWLAGSGSPFARVSGAIRPTACPRGLEFVGTDVARVAHAPRRTKPASAARAASRTCRTWSPCRRWPPRRSPSARPARRAAPKAACPHVSGASVMRSKYS